MLPASHHHSRHSQSSQTVSINVSILIYKGTICLLSNRLCTRMLLRWAMAWWRLPGSRAAPCRRAEARAAGHRGAGEGSEEGEADRHGWRRLLKWGSCTRTLRIIASCKFFGDGTRQSMKTHAGWTSLVSGRQIPRKSHEGTYPHHLGRRRWP